MFSQLSLTSAIFVIITAFAFAPSAAAAGYANTTVPISANTTIAPSAPTSAARMTVMTSTSFKGMLEANPATGVVRVTNAYPAGKFPITVKSFSAAGGLTSTQTFDLDVTTPTRTCDYIYPPAPANYPVAASPYSVAVGDFNGDGKQDIVTGNNNSVSVLLGAGNGTFGSATDFPTNNSYSAALSVGDFNGDGKQDIAAASDMNVSVLLGNGAGGFSAANDVLIGYYFNSLAVADFNGDGKQDIATSSYFSQVVSLILGSGTGTFGAATTIPTTPGTWTRSIIAGDFNGDGKPDIAASEETSGWLPTNYVTDVAILLGTGTGGFGTPITIPSSPFALMVGDFNGDDRQDLSILCGQVLLGTGTGSFSAATGSTCNQAQALGDFNGDGKQDIASVDWGPDFFLLTFGATSATSSLSIFTGTGTGAFSGLSTFGLGPNSSSLAVGDFNGDGKQDIVTTNAFNNLTSVVLRRCPGGPTITANSVIDLGDTNVGTNSAVQSYTVSGNNLTGNIVITPPAHFQISLGGGSSFVPSNPLVLSQSGGTVPLTIVYVRHVPTALGTDAGVITHTSAGAGTRTVSVSGNGR